MSQVLYIGMFKVKYSLPILLVVAAFSIVCLPLHAAKTNGYGVTTQKSGISMPKLFDNKQTTNAFGVSTSSKRSLNPTSWDSMRHLTHKTRTDAQGVTTQKKRKLFNKRPTPFRNMGRAVFGPK